MKSESEVQQLIQIEGPKHGCILLRNNSGAFKDETGRLIRFGLGNVSKKHNDRMKSLDLIGFTLRATSNGNIWKNLPIFTAVEVKKEGWQFTGTKREIAQLNFINWVLKNHGYAGFAQSVEDFLKIINL